MVLKENVRSATNARLFFDIIPSPVGSLLLIADASCLKALLWEDDSEMPDFFPGFQKGEGHPILDKARRQLREYFGRRRMHFDLPLAPEGTPFQKRAWKVLRTIPYGATLSYQEQAAKMGSPDNARAVGGANGKNPISIIVPCHRVIGKNGALTGFGGGLETKRYLLDFEKEKTN